MHRRSEKFHVEIQDLAGETVTVTRKFKKRRRRRIKA